MDKQIERKLYEMPKVVLHLHLDGSLRPETVQGFLKQEGKDISLDKIKRELSVNKDCKDLNQYLKRFDLPIQVLQKPKNLEQASYEIFEDLSKQNVVYAEVRFAPSLHTNEGLSYSQIVESVINGMKRAEDRFSITGNIILCCMRGKNNNDSNIKTLEVADKYLGKGVCGLDLAGAEALFATEEFEDIFREARKRKIPFTIHAGEANGPNSVRKALEFGAKRIGHGVKSIEDKELVDYLQQKEIILEICPISNFQTQAVQGEHPLEKLYKKGVRTTINPDNNTVSSTDIIEEYKWVLENTNLNVEDLIQMNINAARGAFIPLTQIAELISKVKDCEKEENRIK